MKLTGQDVIKAWDNADAADIHPLRAKADLEEYWASGVAQAFEAAEWAGDDNTIIDYGCGEGRIAIPLSRMGYDVFAADTSPVMLSRLKEAAFGWQEQYDHLLPDPGEPGSLTLCNLNTCGLPKDVGLVVCRAVLIHQSHADAARLVGEMAAALKPGGHIVMDWPVGEHYERRHWIDVTRWSPEGRGAVARAHGLELVKAEDGPSSPSVWQKVAME